jgi:hypothetical protein
VRASLEEVHAHRRSAPAHAGRSAHARSDAATSKPRVGAGGLARVASPHRFATLPLLRCGSAPATLPRT